MIKRYPITAKNSTVNSDAGTHYDWSKFDWQGKSTYTDRCLVSNCNHKHVYKAYPAYVDGKATEYYEYLHVPYNWIKDATVFRIRPHFEVGQIRWKHKVVRVSAINDNGKWFWEVELE